MACIRALVMSGYKVINCLISQPKHMLWVLKSTVSMRWGGGNDVKMLKNTLV